MAYDPNVVALLHFDGADGSTTFTDEVGNVWIASGNAQIDTAQSKFGGSSGIFDGSGDYITSYGKNLALELEDFTIEAWLRRNVSATHNIISWGGNNSIYMNSGSNNIFVQIGGAIQITSTAPNVGNWFHIALCRSSGILSFFVDGVKDSEEPTVTANFTDSIVEIGRRSGSANMWNGWVDEFRISKGIARYSSNFTPQSAEFDYTAKPSLAYAFIS